MRIQKLLAFMVVFIFTVIITAGCSKEQPKNATQSDLGKSVEKSTENFDEIVFEIKAPFSTALLKISPEGECSYEASSPKTGIEKQTATMKLTQDEVAILVKIIQDSDFFSLKDSYQPEIPIEDISVYRITVTINGESKQVSCHGYDERPEGFKKVMETIKILWGKDILEVGV